MQATYSGDTQYSSVSLVAPLAVYGGKPIVTAETLSCTPYQIFQGGSAACTIHIPGGATGTVTFSVGGASQTKSLDGNGNATATGELAGAAVGAYIVQATYAGDQNYAGFTTTTAENVLSSKPLPSAFNIGCEPSPVTMGASGSCQVQVSGGATGTIGLYVAGVPITGQLILNANGTATATNLFANLPLGTYTVSGSYSGDPNFAAASAGTTINVVSGDSTPTMSVACSPTALRVNQSSSCTAQMSPGATGSVSFQLDGAPWTSVPVSDSAATTPAGLQTLTAGTHSIVATYSGDSNFAAGSAGTNITVSSAGGATAPVTFACTPSTIISGSPTGTTCTAVVGGGATGGVILYNGSQLYDGTGLDSAGNAVFQGVLAGAAPGIYQLGASYTGDLNYRGTGAQTSVQVVSQTAQSTVSGNIMPTSIPNGAQLALTTWVAPGATGTVTVTANGQLLTQLPLNGAGSASSLLNFTGPSGAGSYTLTFAYSGDANFSPATTNVNLNVTPSSTRACPVN